MELLTKSEVFDTMHATLIEDGFYSDYSAMSMTDFVMTIQNIVMTIADMSPIEHRIIRDQVKELVSLTHPIEADYGQADFDAMQTTKRHLVALAIASAFANTCPLFELEGYLK